ncbi:MAG: DUF4838 domain-containing protein [Kiritimatiellae bacterium]|nr:DUF4838 domain-containing protein [Kiritimatiellia bacterium]
MKMQRIGCVCVVALAVVVSIRRECLAKPLSLVHDGRAEAVIVLAEKPTRAAQFAAFELQWHVKAMTGAELPIYRGESPLAGVRIHVGDGAEARARGLNQESFRPQEYAVQGGHDEILLVGKDLADFDEVTVDPDAWADGARNANWPGLWEERGTLHAVYDFLSDNCGVRWLAPTETGVWILERPTLAVSVRDVRRRPSFRYRDMDFNAFSHDKGISMFEGASSPAKDAGFDAWEALAFQDLHRRYPEAATYRAAKTRWMGLYFLRMRDGGEKSFGCHSMYHYFNLFWRPSPNPEAARHFAGKRPEYFAKGYGGEEPPQLCYTSTGLIDQVVKEGRDYFDHGGYSAEAMLNGSPRGYAWGEDYFAVEPMDNVSFCRCSDCQAFIELGKDHGAGAYKAKGAHSDYFFNFVNEVAKGIGETHPDKRVLALAYGSHSWPPKSIALASNVALQFCFMASGSPFDSLNFENELRLLRAWASDCRTTGRSLSLWTYNMNRQEANIYGNYYAFPDFQGHALAKLMSLYRKLGYDGMFYCGHYLDVDAYLAFRFMDRADSNVDDLLNEYFTIQFGPAARPMHRLYRELESVFVNPRNYPKEKGAPRMVAAWKYLGTAKRMARYEALLKEAEARAATDREKRNVELFELGILAPMRLGRAQYEEREAAALPSIAAPLVPAAAGDLGAVDWSKAVEMGTWRVGGGGREAARKLSGRAAHDGAYLYMELVDPCETRKLYASPMIACYDEWEFCIGSGREGPYHHYLIGPTGMIGARKREDNGVFVPLFDHGLRVVSDTSAPDRWVLRVAFPLKTIIPGGARTGDRIYLNALRVSSPAIGVQTPYSVDSWSPYATVLEMDRAGEILLEKP